MPPRPKVKASGGVPQTMSLASSLSVERGKQSQIAITSRWKCIVPLGLPVVPDVNAMRQMSSRAVSMLPKLAGFAAMRCSRLSSACVAASPLK